MYQTFPTRLRLRTAIAILGTFVLTIVTPCLVVAADEVDREIVEGILDWIHLKSEPPGDDSVIVVRLFDASGADLGTGAEGGKKKRVEAAKLMQKEAPEVVAGELVKRVKKLGPFKDAQIDSGDPLPENSVVVEGRFTILDPGSRAKRFWAGFGAGKGVMEMEGEIKNASGEVLAEFRQKRLTVIGAFGGSYQRKMHADSERFGEDIAEFLHAWATGKKLED